MNTLPQKHLFSLVCFLAGACVMVGVLAPTPVRAGTRQPVLPGGSSLQPGGETAIQMTSELVTFNIRQATEADNNLVPLSPNYFGFQHLPVWFPAVAEVQAEFTLKNPTSQPINLTVWYPLASVLDVVEWSLSPSEKIPRIEDFEAYIDGNPSNAMVSELANPKGADKPDLPWANFPVTFPAGKETVIQIRTRLPLQPSVSGIEMTLYHVFHTAAGWAGPIGQVELILNLPYPASTETLAGIPSGTLKVPPYYRPSQRADLPPGGVLEGNQARWRWKNLEPGSQDDFVLWLLEPDHWQELERARASVQANQADGQAWLNLGTTYYSLSSNGPGWPTVFASIYLPQGIAAYRKSSGLLPGRSAPHAGLGLLTLELYLPDKNAPPEAIQIIQDELQTARELETKNPTIATETGRSRWLLMRLETEFKTYFPDEANATAGLTTLTIGGTMTVPLETASATPTRKDTLTALPTPKHTQVSTPIPSKIPQPVRSLVPTMSPTEPPEGEVVTGIGSGVSTVIIVAIGIIGLVVVGGLAWKGLRKRAGK